MRAKAHQDLREEKEGVIEKILPASTVIVVVIMQETVNKSKFIFARLIVFLTS